MIPRHILLATDLSCRGDRAMDRAVALAEEWKASLTALHVLTTDPPCPAPWQRPLAQREHAQRRLEAELRAAGAQQPNVIVERGQPVPVIQQTLERLGCDLVVVGLPREETLERALLGTTLDGLTRGKGPPVLVVKSRPLGPYRNVVVGTDFSEGSRLALEAALALFPLAQISLFHAYHVPFVSRGGASAALHEAAEVQVREDSRAFLAATPAAAGARVDILCEWGDVGHEFQRIVIEHEVDLVAVGTQGRSRLAELLLGSIARRLAVELTTDVLLVRQQQP